MDTPRIILKDIKMVQHLHLQKISRGSSIFTHGDMDDNVHMQNSIYLISKLQDEGKIIQIHAISGWDDMAGEDQKLYMYEMKQITSGLRISLGSRDLLT